MQNVPNEGSEVEKNATEEDKQSKFCFPVLTPVTNLFIFRSALRKGSIQQVGCDWMVALQRAARHRDQ